MGRLLELLATHSGEDLRAVLRFFSARNIGIATLITTAAIGQSAMALFVAVPFATQVTLLVPMAIWLRRSGRNPTDAAA